MNAGNVEGWRWPVVVCLRAHYGGEAAVIVLWKDQAEGRAEERQEEWAKPRKVRTCERDRGRGMGKMGR